jgi:hypothetical protein
MAIHPFLAGGEDAPSPIASGHDEGNTQDQPSQKHQTDHSDNERNN